MNENGCCCYERQSKERHAIIRIGDNGRCTRLTLLSKGVTPRAILKTCKNGLAHIINIVSQDIGRNVRRFFMMFSCYPQLDVGGYVELLGKELPIYLLESDLPHGAARHFPRSDEVALSGHSADVRHHSMDVKPGETRVMK